MRIDRDTGLRRRELALALLAGLAFDGARGAPLEAELREAVQRIPVPGTGATIVVTSFRPSGKGPHPWIVLSHGTATTPEANRAIDRYRPLPAVREWLRRGYAVLAPVRRGYGASGGPSFGDTYGGCRKADFRAAGEGAAADILATVNWARSESDLDPARWLLVGQSAGAFASIYTAARQPPGLLAVLAFAPGRGGDPATRPGRPCAADAMALLLRSIAARVRVPVLWFYALNDQYIGPETQRLWFDSFQAGGGIGNLVQIPPFRENKGHGVFPSAAGLPLWTAAVEGFARTHALALGF